MQRWWITMADGSIEIDTRINNDGADKGIKALQSKLQSAGDSIKTTGENMSKFLTLPLAAVGGTAIKTAMDFEKGNGKIQASLGVTAEEAKKLGKVAEDVWANNFGENVNDVADGIIKVKQNMGDLSNDDLQKITESALTLRDVFEVDLNDSTKTASTLVKNFGIDGQHAMDLITTGFQKGGDYSGELLDTMNEYAPQFSSMGISADQMLGILISGARAGAFNLDKVGDAVKEFNIRAQDGSKTTADGFAAIGLDARKMGEAIAKGGDDGKKAFDATVTALASMKDPMAQNQAGVALFGTQWEDVRSKVIIAMQQGADSIGNVEGATKAAGNAINNNLGAKAQAVFRKLLDSLKPFGEILLGMATKAIPVISSAIEKLTSIFNSMSPAMQYIVVGVGLFLAALGPLLVIIGTLITSVSTILEVLAPLGPFILGTAESAGFLSTAFTFLTGPVGIIIAAVIGLIAIITALWQNNETFRTNILAIWAEIQNAFSVALNFIMGIVTSVMTSVFAFFGDIWGRIQAFWKENGDGIIKIVNFFIMFIWQQIKFYMGIILGIFQMVWPLISASVQIAWNAIKGIIKIVLDIILGLIQFWVKVFTGDWSGAWNTIKSLFKNIWDDILGIFKGINLVEIGKNIVQGLINGFGSMFGAIKQKVKDLANLIPDGLKKFLGIHSPSKVLADEVGQYLPKGLAKGMDENLDIVTKATNRMAMETIPVNPSTLGISKSTAATISTDNATQNMPPIIVQSVLNGRVIAEETVEPMSYLLQKKMIPRKV